MTEVLVRGLGGHFQNSYSTYCRRLPTPDHDAPESRDQAQKGCIKIRVNNALIFVQPPSCATKSLSSYLQSAISTNAKTTSMGSSTTPSLRQSSELYIFYRTTLQSYPTRSFGATRKLERQAPRYFLTLSTFAMYEHQHPLGITGYSGG